MRRIVVACLLLLSLTGADSARALTLQPVGSGFEEPIYVTSDPGNAGRLLVVERKGRIKLVRGSTVTTFADLTGQVGCGSSCSVERGLLSIALSPDFDSTGKLFVDYAQNSTGTIHVEELTATAPDFETAKASSLEPVVEIPHSAAGNHNGGQLQFGPEGDLFISTGDGGGNNDQLHNAQNPASKLGKILRASPSGGGFTTSEWARGLRNPFRFSFDRLTHDMVIGDVGEGKWEEVDLAPAPSLGEGANYGWNCREGFEVPSFELDPECGSLSASDFTPPVFVYPHTVDPEAGGPARCAIIGGYVARDLGLGALYGHYLYGDNCSGAIRALQLPTSADGQASGDCWTGLTVPGIDSFGEDANGRIYVVSRSGGVYRIEGAPPATCPAPTTGPREEAKPAPATLIGIHAERRRVERGKAAILTVFVSPCPGRRGQQVTLLRNGHANGSRFLDRACTARFVRRVSRGTSFRGSIRQEGEYSAALSRQLRVKIVNPQGRPARPEPLGTTAAAGRR